MISLEEGSDGSCDVIEADSKILPLSPFREQQTTIFLGNQGEKLMEGHLGVQVNRSLGRVELYVMARKRGST